MEPVFGRPSGLQLDPVCLHTAVSTLSLSNLSRLTDFESSGKDLYYTVPVIPQKIDEPYKKTKNTGQRRKNFLKKRFRAPQIVLGFNTFQRCY